MIRVLFKKSVSLLIVLAMLFTIPLSNPIIVFAISAPEINVSSTKGKVGDVVKVAISLESNPGITAMTLNVDYDKSVVHLIELEDNGVLGEAIHYKWNSFGQDYPSPYSLMWANPMSKVNFTFNGEIIVLRFKLIAEVAYTPITVTYTANNILNCDMKPVYFTVNNGSISIDRSEGNTITGINDEAEKRVSNSLRYRQIVNGEIPLATLFDVQILYADALNKLGLFLGTVANAETPIYELDGALTRIQALVLVIRLLGLEEEALAYIGDNNFTDVPNWAWKYAAYAYKKGITTGVNAEGTLYNPSRQVTCQEFTAFLLRVLGYSENNGDFKYTETLDKALEADLYDLNSLKLLTEGQFLRGYAVIAMTEALISNTKGTAEITLIDTLVERKLFSTEEAKVFTEAITYVGQSTEKQLVLEGGR